MAPPPAEEKPDGFKKSGGFAGLMRSGGKPNGTHVYKKDDSFGSTPIVSLFKVVCKAGSAGEISGTEVVLRSAPRVSSYPIESGSEASSAPGMRHYERERGRERSPFGPRHQRAGQRCDA